ncbi:MULTISPECIES: hypothetical protein [unclassified Streptomyces]|uniref:hypothetical protein n=1 Tax=unclassified Streptomyces TaxID=2593676 RepID=UPI002365746D|nr:MULTISPECIES: hypothetical protein [unclassified Streptomyces]MDF3144075.1 hypothetical protein [Streptomyces sp. T21Q-yed]WDF44998.1 hypothetical protein PBV52_24935 [Streptomyces sp. T12]
MANGNSRAADRQEVIGSMVTFLLLLLVAVILGIIGAAADGLGYLLAIGVVLFVADVAFFAVVGSRRVRRPLR